MPALVMVAGGGEQEGVEKGAEGDEEFGNLGSSLGWSLDWGRRRVLSLMEDGGGSAWPVRRSSSARCLPGLRLAPPSKVGSGSLGTICC